MPFSLTPVILIVGGILAAGVVGEGYLLKRSYEARGALQSSLNSATARLKEINDVHREMDKVHGTNNALPDDKLFDSLLPTPAGDKLGP